jgi:hypothetical protein
VEPGAVERRLDLLTVRRAALTKVVVELAGVDDATNCEMRRVLVSRLGRGYQGLAAVFALKRGMVQIMRPDKAFLLGREI